MNLSTYRVQSLVSALGCGMEDEVIASYVLTLGREWLEGEDVGRELEAAVGELQRLCIDVLRVTV